jgi:hypothetical protein
MTGNEELFFFILAVHCFITGFVVGKRFRSEPKPYIGSILLSILIAVVLAALFCGICAGVANFKNHLDLFQALRTMVGISFLISFGMALYCPIPTIIGFLMAKLWLYESGRIEKEDEAQDARR